MNRKLAPLAFAAALLTLTGSAWAQANIDHKKALAGNVTPGDTAGYPITLSQPGHYKLMSNLMVPNGTTGVQIMANGVTLDLNGFTVTSGRTCTFANASYVTTCSANGGQVGIDGGSTANYIYTVRNGMVSGFDMGVLIDGGLVENLVVRYNRVGVTARNTRPVRLTGVLAEYNGEAGIDLLNLASIADNTVASHNTIGIRGDGGAGTVRDSLVTINATGMVKGAMQSTRVTSNKTNIAGTTAY
ncbi:hypothetical protein [Piscinibacter sp.]|uniref:hypothetical protein n=1 Tax=Piscinibacter sp. TaxID=1903157 RepID=UPI002BBCEC29|nr:hypothetical protein [Albitalea sp.]HUG22347.1 hypothetical protein [Albitalea sp.]